MGIKFGVLLLGIALIPWHVEDEFRQVEGVISTTVGYEGGSRPHPTYKDVCTNCHRNLAGDNVLEGS